MKKILVSLLTAAVLIGIITGCSSSKKESKPVNNVFKGKLAVKALCMNYTIQLMEGSLDTSLYVANWKDEAANVDHTNVFALGNPCSFPSTIMQGSEFYFMVDTATTKSECAVCMAYYPVPPRKINIKVVDKPKEE